MRSLVQHWRNFFFAPAPPTPVALFRIVYGLLNIANLAFLRPDWLVWYGPHPFMTVATMHEMLGGPRIDILANLPQTDLAINLFFWVFLAFAIALTLGFRTRLSSIVVYACLLSIHNRNNFIIHSGDTLLRVTGFFLMFAPAGAALSVDRLLRIWRGQEGPDVPLHSPWAQRMIQLQASLLYVSAFTNKMLGASWRNGTAVYYALRLDEFRRFPVPGVDNFIMMRLATWGTLVIEFSMGVLVWVKRLRYPVLLAGLCLHMGIEYSMNLQLFQWTMLSTYVAFIYPDDLARAWAWVRARVARFAAPPVTVVYDAGVPASVRAANLLRAIDVLGGLLIIDRDHAGPATVAAGLPPTEHAPRLLVVTPTGPRAGLAALRWIAPRVPLLWPLAPLARLAWHERDAVPATAR